MLGRQPARRRGGRRLSRRPRKPRAYGETLAQPVADRHTLGSSILITGRQHATPQRYIAPSWTRKFTREELKHRPINSYEYGYWWFEWGGQIDSLKDNEAIRHELLRIALGIWDYVKNSGEHPAAANWALDWVGSIPGKRESRRLLGPHVLVQSDVQGGRLSSRCRCLRGWSIDLHPPQGVDVPDEPPFTPTNLDQVYTIPLRCLCRATCRTSSSPGATSARPTSPSPARA